MLRDRANRQVVRDFTIQVQSSSGSSYDIKIASDGSLWCSCPAWRVSYQQAGRTASDRTCKHITEITRLMAEHYARVNRIDTP